MQCGYHLMVSVSRNELKPSDPDIKLEKFNYRVERSLVVSRYIFTADILVLRQWRPNCENNAETLIKIYTQ